MGREKFGERLKQIKVTFLVYTGLAAAILVVVVNQFILPGRLNYSPIMVFILGVVISFIVQVYTIKSKEKKQEIPQKRDLQQERLEKIYGNKELEGEQEYSNWRRDY